MRAEFAAFRGVILDNPLNPFADSPFRWHFQH
jgi:hypothetical protein